MSYHGRLDFGLLGDYDAMPDIDAVGHALQQSLEELLEAAGQEARGEDAPTERARRPQPVA